MFIPYTMADSDKGSRDPIAAGGKYSPFKIVAHPEKLRSLAEGRVTAPVYVRVKPTNVCNHGCFYCSYGSDDPSSEGTFSGMHRDIKYKDRIPQEKMAEILQDFSDMGVRAVTFSGGGEPLTYGPIVWTLERTLELGIDLSMITNGQRLTGRPAELLGQAHWIRVSMDYCDPETFRKSRDRGLRQFDEVVENVRRFAKSKSPNCSLGVNYVVQEHNYGVVFRSLEFLRDLGVDTVKVAPVWSPDSEAFHKSVRQEVTDQIKEAEIKLTGETFEISDAYTGYFNGAGSAERSYSSCPWMQVLPVIAADQGVYACHNKAYDPEGFVGSIAKQSFRELWFSEETANLFRRFDPRERCKHECAADTRNKLIHQFIAAMDPRVANFV